MQLLGVQSSLYGWMEVLHQFVRALYFVDDRTRRYIHKYIIFWFYTSCPAMFPCKQVSVYVTHLYWRRVESLSLFYCFLLFRTDIKIQRLCETKMDYCDAPLFFHVLLLRRLISSSKYPFLSLKQRPKESRATVCFVSTVKILKCYQSVEVSKSINSSGIPSVACKQPPAVLTLARVHARVTS